jgi:hypothetical protein
MYAEIEKGQYIETETFVTDEGYSWNMHIYPKGTSSGSGKYISMYAYQVGSAIDSELTWPLYGKQVWKLCIQRDPTSPAQYRSKNLRSFTIFS